MSRFNPKHALAGVLFAGVLFAGTPASALNILLRPDASFTQSPNGAAALLGFQKAANYWNQTITSNATLAFDVHFADLGASVLGATYSNTVDTSVAAVYHQLQTTGNSTLDSIATANLRPLTTTTGSNGQTLQGVGYRIPGTDPNTGKLSVNNASSFLDDNNSYNNRFLNANTSVDKGLGLAVNYDDSLFNVYNQVYNLGLNVDADADITFSSTFGFDFDPTNGVSVGTYDFVGVAIHEMGHALGFVSGTDDYEYVSEELAGVDDAYTRADQDKTSFLSTLDLFRYGATSPRQDGGRDLQLDPARDAFFSLDEQTPFNFNGQLGQSSSSFFATGQNLGDGGQASHWQDSNAILLANGCYIDARPIGIMDPTSSACSMGVVTSNDLAAMDAMGWNINTDIYNNRGYTFTTAQAFALPGLAGISGVPEPANWATMLLGFGLIGGAARASRKRVAATA